MVSTRVPAAIEKRRGYAQGNASFGSGAAVFAVPAGHGVFTATATDPDGNRSEFSQCFGTADPVFGNGFDGGCAGYD